MRSLKAFCFSGELQRLQLSFQTFQNFEGLWK